MQIISFCKFHIYSLSDQSYSQQNSSALYEISVIISKLKDLKDIINYRLSCDVITLWAATAAARLSGKRHKVSESSNRSSRCTRETLLADICFPPQQPVGKYVWHCGCSSTITAERLCHWVLMGRSRPVSYTSQLHDYKESCLFLGQFVFLLHWQKLLKTSNLLLTSRYKSTSPGTNTQTPVTPGEVESADNN